MADPRDFYRPDTSQNFRPDRAVGITPATSAPALNMIPGVLPAQLSTTDQGLGALKTLMPELDQFIAKKDKEYSESEIQAGREANLKEAMEYGAAVKAGKIAPNQSKWFMKGYKAQYGEATGQQWALEAKTAWMQSEAKNSDDPNAAASFIRDFTAKKLGSIAGLDPDVRAGLLPQLSNMHGAVMAAQAEYSAKLVYDKNLELLGTNVVSDIDAYVKSHGTMPMAELFAKIKSRDAAGRLQGVNNDDLNKTIVDAFVQKSREANSVSLLKVVQQYDKIGNNPKYLGAIRSAQDAIENKQIALDNRAMAVEARNYRLNGQRITMGAFDTLMKQKAAGQEPHLTDDIVAAIRKSGNGEAGIAVMKLFQDQGEEDRKMTPAEIQMTFNRVSQAGPQEALKEVNLMMGEGHIRSKEGAQFAFNLAKQFQDQHITSSHPYTEGTSRLQSLARQDQMGPAMINPAAANEAVTAFQRDFVVWKSQHMEATDAEVDAMKNRLIDMYSSQLESYKMTGGKDFYRGDIVNPNTQQYGPTAAPQGTGPAPQAMTPEELVRERQRLMGTKKP